MAPPVYFGTLKKLTYVIGLDVFSDDKRLDVWRLNFVWLTVALLSTQQLVSAFFSQDIVVMAEGLTTCIALLCSLVKLTGVRAWIPRTREMYRTLDQLMKEQEELEDREVLRVCERRVRLTAAIFLVADLTAGTGAVLPALLHNLSHPERMVMPLKGWFPFDVTHLSTASVLACGWMSYSTLMGAYNVGLMRIFFFSSSLYVSTQMSVFTNHLKQLDPAHPDRLLPAIKSIVQFHVVVLRLGRLMNEVWAYAVLFEVVLAAIQFCLLITQVSRVPISDHRNMLWIPMLIGSVISLLLICLSGELLKSKSAKMMEAVYAVPWYEMTPLARREVLFTLRQSSRVLTLNVRGYFVMDMELFLKTMQSAYTYLTLLSTVE